MTLNVMPPEPDPDATTRQRYAQHVADESCASCHDHIDPLGFGFEHYDGLGRYRSEENGQPIDATGWLLVNSNADGPYEGAPELAARLAASDVARECFVDQLGRFVTGRIDGQLGPEAHEVFAEADTRIDEVIHHFLRSERFVRRSGMEEER